MSHFDLPETRPDQPVAFSDPDGAGAWLAAQPQANAPAMQAGLVREITALNGLRMDAAIRLKTLEALRRACFAIDRDCQKRFENRPVPLPRGEQSLLDNSRHLWRALATGYLHCLRGCLDGTAPVLARLHANVSHRVIASLRMEQLACYLANAEPEGHFWSTLHATFRAAEQLGSERELVSDKLLGETRESSVSGQYAMALLLHLARPFELSRAQFSAVSRWLARWREQAGVLMRPDELNGGHCLALDLSTDIPFSDPSGTGPQCRWLAVSGVQRKIRKRVELLAAGETPEDLRLGSTLTSEACHALLTTLNASLATPAQAPAELTDDCPSLPVVTGLENIHQLLGGTGLAGATTASTQSSRLAHDQLAVFGHIRRDSDAAYHGVKPETWRLARHQGDALCLIRPATEGSARLAHRNLIAVQLPENSYFSLAWLDSLCVRPDGSLYATASCLPGEPAPMIVDMRERTGAPSRHPAFMLGNVGADAGGGTLVLPLGVPTRAASLRFMACTDVGEVNRALRLSTCIERGGDSERWAFIGGASGQ